MFKSILFYTNKLKLLKRFYRNVLNLEITKASDEKFTVKIGESEITFIQSECPSFYHFAINIPGNQFTIMKNWIQDRLPLNYDAGVNQFYSSIFNADSIYFEDPAGNLVKLIGRRNKDLFGDLTSEAFLNVGEVSIVTPFVSIVGEEIQDFDIPLNHSVKIDPEALNYLGYGDTFITLAAPAKEWMFSQKRATESHPLEITLNDGGHILLDDHGQITLTRKAEEKEEEKEEKEA